MPVPHFGPELAYRIDDQIKLLCVRINRFILECLVFGNVSQVRGSSSYSLIKFLSKELNLITNNLKKNIRPANPKIIDYMASTTWTISIFSENLSNNLKFLKQKKGPQSPQPACKNIIIKNNERKSYYGT